MSGSTPAVPSDDDIRQLYSKMGLTLASDRARYVGVGTQTPKLVMTTVISTTSQPFGRNA